MADKTNINSTPRTLLLRRPQSLPLRNRGGFLILLMDRIGAIIEVTERTSNQALVGGIQLDKKNERPHGTL